MWKTSYSFNDSKWKRIVLSCSKKLLALLKGISSKHKGDFYCLNCLNFFRTIKKRELHKIVCENKVFSNTVRPSEDTKY